MYVFVAMAPSAARTPIGALGDALRAHGGTRARWLGRSRLGTQTRKLGKAQLNTETATQDPKKASEAHKRFPGLAARPSVAIAAHANGTSAIKTASTCVHGASFGGRVRVDANPRVSMSTFAGVTDPSQGLDRISTVGTVQVNFQGRV